jgi:hypothetical protein
MEYFNIPVSTNPLFSTHGGRRLFSRVLSFAENILSI